MFRKTEDGGQQLICRIITGTNFVAKGDFTDKKKADVERHIERKFVVERHICYLSSVLFPTILIKRCAENDVRVSQTWECVLITRCFVQLFYFFSFSLDLLPSFFFVFFFIILSETIGCTKQLVASNR